MFCKCGCGQEAKPGNIFIHGHARCKTPHTEKISQLCACGKCGRMTRLGKKYISGHNITSSTFRKGCPRKREDNPFYGRHHTQKTKDDQSKLLKEKYKNGELIHWNKGKVLKGNPKYSKMGHRIPHTKESKELIRKAALQEFIDHPEYREDLRIKRSKQILPLKDTSIEVMIQTLLTKLNIPFEKHKTLISLGIVCDSNLKYHQVDIVIPEHKLIIECDGVYWHSSLQAKERDMIMDKLIIKHNWHIIRFTDFEISKNIENCERTIWEFIGPKGNNYLVS